MLPEKMTITSEEAMEMASAFRLAAQEYELQGPTKYKEAKANYATAAALDMWARQPEEEA